MDTDAAIRRLAFEQARFSVAEAMVGMAVASQEADNVQAAGKTQTETAQDFSDEADRLHAEHVRAEQHAVDKRA
jgi:hypothetical protein